MQKKVILTREKTGEGEAFYKAEGTVLSALLGIWPVLGPGRSRGSLRLLTEKKWEAIAKLYERSSLEDKSAMRASMATACRPNLSAELLAVPQRLLDYAPLGERCCLEQLEEGVWVLTAREE